MIKADMHIHTFYSDGLMSPSEAVSAALRNGVKLISVTDHDTVLGVAEARSSCSENSIKFINGVEISAYESDVKLHTLGYCFNGKNSDLLGFLKKLKENSVKRTEDIIHKLNLAGVRISFEDAAAMRNNPDTPIHTMHIARAGEKKGYAKSAFAFFSDFLAKGKCGYSGSFRPSPEEAIEVINAAGGFASLAHPGRIDLPATQLKSLIYRLKDCGLRGIEAVHSAHTKDEQAYYKEMAEELNLMVTGGSDTHVETRVRKVGKPCFSPDKTLLERLEIEI